MRYSADHKEDSRRRILTAAARTIRELGPRGVSVSAVMAEAGLTHGGFYAHFQSKSALIAAAIDTMFSESAARLTQRLEALEPRAALNAHIEYYLSPRHCERRDAGCPIAALGSEAPRLDAEAQSAFARGLERRRAYLETLLRGAGFERPEEAAHSLHAELLGALVAARLAPPAERKDLLAMSQRIIRERFGLAAR